jgi:hypothetical protein
MYECIGLSHWPVKWACIYLSLCPSIHLSMALQSFVGPWQLISFLIVYTVGRTPWTGDQHVARPLQIYRTNAQTSMPRVEFELTNPVFERAKAVPALDRASLRAASNCFAKVRLPWWDLRDRVRWEAVKKKALRWNDWYVDLVLNKLWLHYPYACFLFFPVKIMLKCIHIGFWKQCLMKQ